MFTFIMKSIYHSKNHIINKIMSARKYFLFSFFILLIPLRGAGQLIAEFFASSTNICSGSLITFTDNSAGITDTTIFKWNFGTDASPSSATGKGPHVVSYSGSGTRTVSLTLTDMQTVTKSKTNYITVNQIPLSPEVKVTDNCDGTSTLSSSAAGTFLWSTKQMSSAITVSSPGIYTLTTTVNGCTSSAGSATAAPKIAPALPVVSIDCSSGYNKGVVNITSPLGSGYEYRLDGGSYRSQPSFSNVSNGSHQITVRNSSGCTSTGNYFEVSCDCNDAASVTLSSTSGIACGVTPITVSGNTFEGSATWVSITENGDGSVSPSISLTSPFTFTYTPKRSDEGETVTITITTNNPAGTSCVSAKETYLLKVSADPQAPEIGKITQPTCSEQTGSVVLTALPSTGIWTIVRNPGEVTTTGSGTSVTIMDLATGSYTFKVLSEAGCVSKSSETVVIIAQPLTPLPPEVGILTPPSCTVATGSVVVNGLPATGSWTLIRNPGAVTSTGSGTSRTITGVPAGTYSFSVINSSGCTSLPSVSFIINQQPASPGKPIVGTIVPPTCTMPAGSVEINGLPATGTWVLTRNPGAVSTTGTGPGTTISGLLAGTYNFIVTSTTGCSSATSANAVIPVQPSTPAAPAIGAITVPTCTMPTGSVVLNGLPSSGQWTLTRYPDGMKISGTGTTKTISGQFVGTYTFTVTSQAGCVSQSSSAVVIPVQPGIPVVIITDPPAVCAPLNVDLTNESITSGSTPGLTFTYWTNITATKPYPNPAAAVEGTYYIKGTTTSGCFDIKPVIVKVDSIPIADAGPDQVLEFQFGTTLNAVVYSESDIGVWYVISGKGNFSDVNYASTYVNGLSTDLNEFLWAVTRGSCPVAYDTVMIIVHDLDTKTLITPNMDGKNDYFVIKGLSTLGKTELVIFDRRGVQVYKNENYDNSWNGIDYNANPLQEDTYFYVLRTENNRSVKGFIVIRR